MADIGQLVGTLLASLAHARRITDQETVAIAEYYKDNPLLEGMSVPSPTETMVFLVLGWFFVTLGEYKTVRNNQGQELK